MNLTETTQAILLLTAYFTKPSKGTVRPLTTGEWGRFALWLKEKGLSPEDLLLGNLQEQLNGWHDKTVTQDRIHQLLDRGHALGLALEKWQRAGIWVLTRSDSHYPKRLKARLRTSAPPLFFGVGNKELLSSGGVAVVGSRNASEEDLLFTSELGAKAAESSVSVVSGGARGVDETAMTGALNAGGHAVGVLPDSLLRAATASKWRQGLMENRLVLISPFYPEAGFSTGNAMSRNQYIYCISDAAMVIHSGTKGGSWNGANENLKKSWVPLWVKPTNDQQAGNKALVESGGIFLETDIKDLDIKLLMTPEASAFKAQKINDLFANNESQESREEIVESPLYCEQQPPAATLEEVGHEDVVNKEEHKNSFYQLFLEHLSKRHSNSPLTEDSIAEELFLHKSQVKLWLQQAVDEDFLSKSTSPVRYQWKNPPSSPNRLA